MRPSPPPCFLTIMQKNIPKEFEFLGMFLSADLIVPIATAAGLIFIIYRLYVLNYESDEMEVFIKVGGDKRDEKEFEKFVKARKFYNNGFLLICMFVLIVFYACFLADVLF